MTIECSKCQTDNPDLQKFCGECATPLEPDVVHTKILETPTEELTGGSVFTGRYEIIEELGKGWMGRVYRIEDTKAKEEIALKLIKPDIAADKKTIERFRNELTTARKITHKNVCRMYDLGEENGLHFITMEYISGQDLKGLIRQTGQLTVGKVLSIAKQICDGLSEAHNLGIVHRDLKPNNIMIDDNGNARIMDFGIARTVKGKGIPGSGIMIGTPEYMSPEQAEAKEVDQRSDIYSFGIMLYEMTTGRLPFDGDTPLALAMKHKGKTAKSPKEFNPQIPDDLSGVILKCLEKEKEKRHQSVGDLRSELAAIEKERTSILALVKKVIQAVLRTFGFEIRKIPDLSKEINILDIPQEVNILDISLEDPEAMVKDQLHIFKAVTGQDYDAIAETRYPINHVYEVNKPFSDPEGLSGDLLIATGTIIKLLHLKAGASVLDLGCGSGWTSILLAHCGFQVTGVDINSSSLAIGRRNAEERGIPVKFINKDIQSFTVNQLFDAVVIFDSLHHCLREHLVLAKAMSALRPGGKILMCEQNYPDEDSAGVLTHKPAIQAMRKHGTLEKGLGTRYLIRVLFDCGFEMATVFTSQGHYRTWHMARKPQAGKKAVHGVITTSDLKDVLQTYE